MRKVLSLLTLAASLVAALATTTLAGPNAGGSLLVHTKHLVVTSDVDNYCPFFDAQSCDQIVSRVDGTSVEIFWVVAAFPQASAPRVAAVSFGWVYPAGLTFLGGGSCGDFELATAGWPNSGEGTAITWNAVKTANVFQVYWGAAYDYYGTGASICLTPHPSQGAVFADDAVPANLDPIAALGCLGFNQDGIAPCPGAGAIGACCFADGSCAELSPDACAANGGTYQGDGTTCAGSNCGPTPGACCHVDGTCELLTEFECSDHGDQFQGPGTACDPSPCPPAGACCVEGKCEFLIEEHCVDHGGVWLGSGSDCDPDPCGATPTRTTTWGGIKATQR